MALVPEVQEEKSSSVLDVASAMAVIQEQVDKFTTATDEAEVRAKKTAANISTQTAIKVAATEESVEAATTIGLEQALAKQRMQRNILAVFNAAGGQQELLEEAGKQFAASEEIDRLEEGIDKQKEQEYGLGFIDNIINEFRVMDDRQDVLEEKKDQVRAERNIAGIAKVTREAAQINQLTMVTATDASILAAQSLAANKGKIAVADAQIKANTTNAEAMAKVLTATGQRLDAHVAGFKAIADTHSLEMRSKEVAVRIREIEARLKNLPETTELLHLQLEQARRDAEVDIAGHPGEIETDELKLAALREEVAQTKLTNPDRARAIAAQADSLELELEIRRATKEKEILRINAASDAALVEYRLQVEEPEELAAAINLGRDKVGLPALSVVKARQVLENPNTAAIATHWLMAGTSPGAKLGNSAADSIAIKANAEAAGVSLPVTPVSKAQDIIIERFTTVMADLEAEGTAPDDDLSQKVLLNSTARVVMKEFNENPINDKDLNNPYLLPPTESLALHKGVQETVLWQKYVSLMEVDRLDTRLLYDTAVTMARLGIVSPEQAAKEFGVFFKAGVSINDKILGGWERNNLPPQTKYILELDKPATTIGSLIAGAGTIAEVGVAEVISTVAGTEVPFLEMIAKQTSDKYRIDALKDAEVLNILVRDMKMLGPMTEAETKAGEQ